MRRFISKIVVPDEITGIPMLDRIVTIILRGQLGQELVECISDAISVGTDTGLEIYNYNWYGNNDPSTIKNLDTRIHIKYKDNGCIFFRTFSLETESSKHCYIPIDIWLEVGDIIQEKINEEKKRHKEIRYRIKKAEQKLDKVNENITYLNEQLHNNYLDTDI